MIALLSCQDDAESLALSVCCAPAVYRNGRPESEEREAGRMVREKMSGLSHVGCLNGWNLLPNMR